MDNRLQRMDDLLRDIDIRMDGRRQVLGDDFPSINPMTTSSTEVTRQHEVLVSAIKSRPDDARGAMSSPDAMSSAAGVSAKCGTSAENTGFALPLCTAGSIASVESFAVGGPMASPGSGTINGGLDARHAPHDGNRRRSGLLTNVKILAL